MSVARNVVFNPMLAPGGGATEMAVSVGLQAKARTIVGVEGWPYRAVADAMEVIPRTLVQNSGGNAIRVLTELRVSALSLFCWVTSNTHALSGQTRQRRTLLGSQWRDW
jgi:chaperonin GroEL (HSP60 family)